MAFTIGQALPALTPLLALTPAAPFAPIVAGAAGIVDGTKRNDPWAIVQGVASAALPFLGTGSLSAFQGVTQTGVNMLGHARQLASEGHDNRAKQWHRAGLAVLSIAAQIAPGGWSGSCGSVGVDRWDDLSVLTDRAEFLARTAHTLGDRYSHGVSAHRAFEAVHAALSAASAWSRT